MSTPLFVLAEATTDTGGINPWVVGGGVLLLLALLMAAVVAFGGGREHS
jgi:high-affinity Fe2+/Pb2+ permease